MTPGPRTGSRPIGLTFAEKVASAYDIVPDWLLEMARFADREGLKGAAARLGYSTSVISTVINGKYAGDIARVEEMVRGALMAATVDCPVLGEIGRDRCLSEQRQPFRATSAFRAQLYHACRGGCPHSSHIEGKSHE